MEVDLWEKRMNRIGTIAGIQAAFGARWDDSGRGSRMRTRFSDTVGFYDESGIGRDAHPAPAIVHPMLEIDDPMAACAVFYHDDAGKVFGSVVLSAGQVAPLSEIVHESGADWRDAILRSKDDANLDQVFFPEGVVDGSHVKLRPYAVSARKVDLAALPRIRPRHISAGMLVLAAAALAAFSVAAWTFFSGPGNQSAQEAEFEIERIRTEYAGLLERCRSDLREPWPAPPEWTLRQEGCVGAPELARIGFPKPVSGRPYVYRYYELDGAHWDEYLSRASFEKMADRFPGQFIGGPKRFVLYMTRDVEKSVVDDAYLPDGDPASILRRNFVGAIRLSAGGAGAGGVAGFTDLELGSALERLSGKRLTPNHVYRNLKDRRTGIEASPERVETRQIRVR